MLSKTGSYDKKDQNDKNNIKQWCDIYFCIFCIFMLVHDHGRFLLEMEFNSSAGQIKMQMINIYDSTLTDKFLYDFSDHLLHYHWNKMGLMGY